MIDELKLGQQQNRGAAADALFNSELFQEAFAKLEASYMDAWRNETNVKDVEARENYWRAIHVLGKVKNHLKQLINDGKVATRDLAVLSADAERKAKKR